MALSTSRNAEAIESTGTNPGEKPRSSPPGKRKSPGERSVRSSGNPAWIENSSIDFISLAVLPAVAKRPEKACPDRRARPMITANLLWSPSQQSTPRTRPLRTLTQQRGLRVEGAAPGFLGRSAEACDSLITTTGQYGGIPGMAGGGGLGAERSEVRGDEPGLGVAEEENAGIQSLDSREAANRCPRIIPMVGNLHLAARLRRSLMASPSPVSGAVSARIRVWP